MPARSLRHLLASTLILLALGAFLTIAAAWSLAFFIARVEPRDTFRYTDLPASWPLWVPADWPAYSELAARRGIRARAFEHSIGSVYLSRTQLAADTAGRPMAYMYVTSRTEAGIPFRAFASESGEAVIAGAPVKPAIAPGLLGGFALYAPLPMSPLWPAFAADTLFFGAVVWSARTTIRAISRRLRIKPGHCPSCGYSLSGLAPGSPCPECGGTGRTPINDTSPRSTQR